VQYQNPKPKEGINYSKEHPLKEFAQLLIGVAITIALLVLLLNYFAGMLARYIPFEFEQKMVGDLEFAKVESSPQQQYLQSLADRLAVNMELPEGMAITVHYNDSEIINAFATMGGNLVFFKGLIDKLESEDELAAVMGHEIAHIKYRHPIVALGKGLTLASLAAFVSGASASSAGSWLIGNSVNLSLMKFSRDQESASDIAAAKALIKEYGHIGGADMLFKHFSELEGENVDRTMAVEMFRSHPYSEDRWDDLETLAREHGWQTKGEFVSLEFPKKKKNSD